VKRPESNGRVGPIGGLLRGLHHCHVDGVRALGTEVRCPLHRWLTADWDDWFHNGAFDRTVRLIYLRPGGDAQERREWWSGIAILTTEYLGSARSAMAASRGLEASRLRRAIAEHTPTISFCRIRPVDKLLAKETLHVPMLIVSASLIRRISTAVRSL